MLKNLRQLFKANKVFLASMVKYGKLCMFTQLLLICFGIPLNLLQLYMPKYFIEEITSEEHPINAIKWIVFLVIGQLAFILFSNLSNLIRENSCAKAKLIVKEKTLNHFMSLYLSYFDNPEKLNNIQRALSYGETGGTSFFMFLVSIINSIASLATMTFVSIKFQWWIWIIILLIFIIKSFIGGLSKKRIYNYLKDKTIRDRTIGYYSGVISSKNNLPEIRIFNSYNFFLNKYRSEYLKSLKIQNSHNLIITALVILEQVPDKIFDIISYLIIGFRLYSNNATLGDYTLFFSMITQINMLLNNFKGMLTSLTEHGLAANNYLEFMDDMSETIENNSDKVKIDSIDKISFKNVSFEYKSGQPVLKNINLNINKGEKIGILGLNGAGKTTFLKLLLLLYKIEEGEIKVNDIDIKNIDINTYYKKIGAVLQNHNLYSLTLAENIAMSEKYSEKMVNEVLSVVGLKAKFEKYPEGILKPISYNFHENGIELSGGELQRIAIARALYKTCDLYILDEPSSNLDILSQNELCRFIYNLPRDKTAIFISHRLSDMKLADKVIVLDEGSIIAIGTHNELLENCKKYKEMYKQQQNLYSKGEK